ncbi:MAG: class I SAM-dependent methyltransferase [Oscillospiraceae bacterium]|nr:class I SAM-dependent methyltransferase [Oscillospiraceae bacterium]
MSSNQDRIREKYSHGKEGERAFTSRSESLEFHYTKKILSEYIKPDSRVIEIGCGGGYYGMYFADKCTEYVGVDITPENIAAFEEKIKAAGLCNVQAFVGDAIHLYNIADGSFDVVLCLGPMYHLPQEERELVFAECKRIAEDGAIIAFAYIIRIGVYAAGCVVDKWRDRYPNAEANKYILEYSTSDDRPGLFFMTSPEEMEHDAKQYTLEVLKNCGLDFIFASYAIDMMSEEKFNFYWELADRMSESQSCTGLSNHALLICRK